MTTTLNYPARWTPLGELTEESTSNSDCSAQYCASPVTPHASPRWEVNPPVVVESHGSLDSPIGDEHLAPAAKPPFSGELSDSLYTQAGPATTVFQNDIPLPSQCALFGEEDTAPWDGCASLFPELGSRDTYSRYPPDDTTDLPGNLDFPNFSWHDPLLDTPWDGGTPRLSDAGIPWDLQLDETGQEPRSSLTAHSAAISRRGPDPLLAPLAYVWISMQLREIFSLYLSRSQRPSRFQEPHLHENNDDEEEDDDNHEEEGDDDNHEEGDDDNHEKEEDNDVILIKSVSICRKRPHDLSAGISDDSYPAKRRGPRKVNARLPRVFQQFCGEKREYKFIRATGRWEDCYNDTILPDVRDYKTLTVKIRPYGLEPVYLSWDEGMGKFCGYDVGRVKRLVTSHDVEKLMKNPRESLEIDWPAR